MVTKKKSKSSFYIAILPAIFAICLYVNTIPNQYCLDDTIVVCNNSYVHAGLRGIPDILTTNFFNGFNKYNDGLYRPLPVLTYAVEYFLWGLNPNFSHVVNIFIYALIAFFLLLFLKKILPTGSGLLPLSVVLLFIAHPVHTEVVSNIKGRDDLLAFLFSILSVSYLLEYIDRSRLIHLIFGLLSYLLALLSKESAVMFLFIIPLTIIFFRKIKPKLFLRILLPLVILTVAWLLWRSHIIHSMSQPVYKGIITALNNSILSTGDTFSRIATGLYFQSLYLLKLIMPVPLSHDYSFNQLPVIPAFSPQAILSLMLILALIAYAILYSKKQKPISFGILYYFISIAVVANIFIYIGATFAERFLFSPSLGFSIVTGVLLYKLVNRNLDEKNPGTLLTKNIPYAAILSGILLFYSVKTISRNFEWKDNITLYSADINHSHNSARMHFNYGSGLFEKANNETSPENRNTLFLRALSELHAALRIYPDYSDALINTGNIYQKMQQPDSAIACYQKILKIDSSNMETYYNLGYTCYSASKFNESIYFLKKFLTAYPNSEHAYFLIGSSFSNLENYPEAIGYLEKCISLDERDTDALVLLGIAYEMVKRYDKAIELFNRILQSDPSHLEATFNLGMLYRGMNQPDRGIEYFLKCIQIDPLSVPAYRELIRSYQISGDNQKAEFYKQKLAEIEKH